MCARRQDLLYVKYYFLLELLVTHSPNELEVEAHNLFYNSIKCMQLANEELGPLEISNISFHLLNVDALVIVFVVIFEQNNPPPQPLDFFPKVASNYYLFPIVGFAHACEHNT